MQRGNSIKIVLFVISLMLFMPVLSLAQTDFDSDGVLDEVDMCEFTNIEEGLPIAQNKDYLGCSCSQIQEKLGDYACYDVVCSPNRRFSIRERTYSSREISCNIDYCVDSKLYDFPNITQLKCFDGKEEELNCNPIIKENSKDCIDGLIPQFVSINQLDSKPSGMNLLDDFEKLQNRAYDLSTNDPTIKSGLGISNKEIFLSQAKKSSEVITIEKSTVSEIKMFGSSQRTITTNTIKLDHKKFRKVKKVYVFEELPRGAKLQKEDLISLQESLIQEEGPILLVWEIDVLDDSVDLSYQINRPFQGETNTFIIAKEIKNTAWKLMFIPLVLIILFVWIFIYISEKSVPKRKKIFKEK